MKNIISLLLILSCVIFTVSCKEKINKAVDSESTDATSTDIASNSSLLQDTLMAKIKNMTKIYPEEVQGLIDDAKVIINHRWKETDRKSFIMLDKDLWEYEFIFTGKSMSKPNEFDGYWIDFSEDLTYTYGRFQEDLGKGTYTYSIDSGLLLLIDDSPSIKPQEFEAKLFDQTLIMDGNSIYKDNNYNAKLTRITSKPSR
ncbi:MAG: hypothetical protein P1U56_20150 [Saprospiraceae bacterium]|nr:hypothetical protein [Saprospiraceae bacterium]